MVLLSIAYTFCDVSAPLRLDNPDFDHINNIFDELGPIPRLCIEYTKRDLSKYRTSLSMGLSALTIRTLNDLVGGARSLSMDASGERSLEMHAMCHKICLVRRL